MVFGIRFRVMLLGFSFRVSGFRVMFFRFQVRVCGFRVKV